MGKKILIVDDQVFILALLEQALEDFVAVGVELLQVNNGQRAWEVAQATHPDLVILDVMMPGLSGYQVCQRIKSDPNLFHTHVIMLTAQGQEIDRLHSAEVRADEYITKPFDPDYLIERVADVLGVEV